MKNVVDLFNTLITHRCLCVIQSERSQIPFSIITANKCGFVVCAGLFLLPTLLAVFTRMVTVCRITVPVALRQISPKSNLLEWTLDFLKLGLICTRPKRFF